MSAYETAFTLSMASAGTLTGAIDLQRYWAATYLAVPSMATATKFYIQGSDSLTGTFRRVKHPAINAAVTDLNDFILASATTNCLAPIPNGVRFLKLETQDAVASGQTFQIICGGEG